MDGNGRWAKARGLSRSAGHVAGAKVVESTLSVLREYGVEAVTLYAFSTENWNRPKEEVDGLMKLFSEYLSGELAERIISSSTLSLRFIGERDRLPEDLRVKFEEIENKTAERPFVCNLAINYGGRDEIVSAAKRLAALEREITKESLSEMLYTAGVPDPDLIIRTGGEKRISNFLLWQAAYSELVFTDTLWPDLDRAEIERCLLEFFKRKRRYGGLNAEDLKEEAGKKA